MGEEWQKARKKPVIVEFKGPFEDGRYLIRDVDGNIYAVDAEYFEETYAPLPTIDDSFRCVDCGKFQEGHSEVVLYRKEQFSTDDPTYIPAKELCSECA